MPGKGTDKRNVRVQADLWDPALAKASNEGASLSTVVRVALADFLAAPPRVWPPDVSGRPVATQTLSEAPSRVGTVTIAGQARRVVVDEAGAARFDTGDGRMADLPVGLRASVVWES